MKGRLKRVHNRHVVQASSTFPHEAARKHVLVYVLGPQSFGKKPFTAAELVERTRLSAGTVASRLTKLVASDVAVVHTPYGASKRTGAQHLLVRCSSGGASTLQYGRYGVMVVTHDPADWHRG
ncbi:hypothetical protein ACFYXM_11765 [Streptomyces sp. NPDC002476]|uniref:hypothetical protein n=1 Tax=Streptomyces sp. NPDC002476 TaxID=3364648 RepID=UPI00369996E5